MDTKSGEMKVFIHVVETGSFSTAANLLKMTPSAVSKLITRVENRLGVLLFKRSTRYMALTTEGSRFYESCVRILDDIEEAEQSISDENKEPKGLLRINLSLPFGTHHVIPLISLFRKKYPRISLDLSLTDALVDLQREQVDVAIRMGPLSDSSYHARKLGDSRLAIVASPKYVSTYGTPKTPYELINHKCFNFNFRRSLDEWPFLISEKMEHLPVKAEISTNNGETMRQLTLDGLGISRLAMFHISEDIKTGKLIELLHEFNPTDREEIHAIYTEQRYIAARVRVFIDFLVEHLQTKLENY
jgi:DNA-binding transcriptional LysR family regulator